VQAAISFAVMFASVAPAPLHVIVDAVPAPDSWARAGIRWVIAGTIASIAVAVFNAVLAKSTSQLANQTKLLALETAKVGTEAALARRLADKHHQESLMPVLLVEAVLYVNTDLESDTLGFELVGQIQNVGAGPATEIVVHITVPELTYNQLYFGALAGNADLTIRHPRWTMKKPEKWFRDAGSREPLFFKAKSEFKSLFGSKGCVTQQTLANVDSGLLVNEIQLPEAVDRLPQ